MWAGKTEVCMKTALIWDLDGTLIDSYGHIIECLLEIVIKNKIEMDYAYIERFVKQKSVHDFLLYLSGQSNVEISKLRDEYSEVSREKGDNAKLMQDAKDTLETLKSMGVRSYLFTHKGNSTQGVLRKLGIDKYFNEIINASMGFARKPEPEAIDYLIEKYRLEKSSAYYVGDRDIDVQCAVNAGIKSILLESEFVQSEADYRIGSLNEICGIVKLNDDYINSKK